MANNIEFEKVFDPSANIELDTTLTQEGKAADAKAVGLRFAALGDGVGGGTSIGTYSAGLEYTMKDNGEYEVTGIGTCTDKHIVIPSMIGSVRVTSIGDNAFKNCTTFESITIPSSVTSIGKMAFTGASGLKSITIPSGVSSMGEDAFRNCGNLEKVIISDGVTNIGSWVFCYCSKLASVTIPKSVTTIGEKAFAYSYSGLKFYCEAESQPSGWDANWNVDNFSVVWGAALDFASVNNKLASGGGGASVSLDTTLTQEGKAADARAVGDAINSIKSTINDLHTTGAEIYLIIEDGATPAKLEDAFNENFGFIPQLIIEMVDTPPETMEEADQNNQIVPLSIVKSTGIVYANFGAGVMPFGVGFFRQDGFDKGWTDDINTETEAGVYCVRTTGNTNNASGGLSIRTIEFTDRPSLYAWLCANYNKVLQFELNSSAFIQPFVFESLTAYWDSSTGAVSSIKLSKIFVSGVGADYITLSTMMADILSDRIVTVADIKSIRFNVGENPTVEDDTTMDIPDEYWIPASVVVNILYVD